MPQSVPQWQAYLSPADELFYGGQAGGGKSSLLLGLAVTAHSQSIIFRREYRQLVGASGLIQYSRDLLEPVARYNGQELAWRDIPGNRSLEFGAVQYPGDERKFQGRPHDFIGFDEVSELLESQFRFLTGWLRSIDPDQRCRIVAAGNPPTRAEGEWVITYWGPWLDEHHPNPAEPGELRWFAVVDGKDVEVDGPEPFEHGGEVITPKSRSFVPAALADNPYLAETGYRRILQGLPEPLRSQLLYGDFTVGTDDDPYQIIPTEWVRLAQARWTDEPPEDEDGEPVPLTVLSCDVARGGADKTVIGKRYDNWVAPLKKYPGKSTPDGPAVAALVMKELPEPDRTTPIHVDVIGVGTSVYDTLRGNGYRVVGVNFGAGSKARDRTRQLKMRNVRAEAWWKTREALDPDKGDDIALPPDSELLADLVAPRWEPTPSGIKVEDKEEVKKRIGRSPDCGDAVVMLIGVRQKVVMA